jgi:hypothetical protein
MDILKEIKNNNLLKIVLVLAGIYLFLSFKKEQMGDIYYETVDNVDMPSVPSVLAPAVAERKTLDQVRQESVQKMGAAQMAQPIMQEATGSTSFTPQQDQATFERVVGGVPALAAEDLLPKYDEADKFAKENPISKLLKEQNFLISGYHVGINTVLQSNKIPYHDLRSAPPIPKETVGPWSQSSYETPMGANRRQLEIA